MIINNHIAWRFLMDVTLQMEIMEKTYPGDTDKLIKYLAALPEDQNWEIEDIGVDPRLIGLYHSLSTSQNKNYYVTETVLDKLEMLKVSKNVEGRYNYSVFNHLPNCKRTFIFPDNSLLRLNINNETMHFFHLHFWKSQGGGKAEKHAGHMQWDMYWVNRDTGEEHSNEIDKKHMEMYGYELRLYRLLCFMFLTENDEVIVPAGGKHGTKKSGKLINSLNVPVTIVNSRWNTTVIRNESFDVRGHFRLQPHGPQMSQTKIIFIDPFTKNGYVRKALSENENKG